MNERLLKLTVLKDRVVWEVFNCGDGDSRTRIDYSDHAGIPLDRDDLRSRTITLLADLQQRLADARRSAKADAAVAEAIARRVVEALGEHLYRFLFRSELPNKLNDALKATVDGLLRIELEFQGDALKEYGAWPWEYLRSPLEQGVEDSGEFLALRTQLVLNRRLYLPGQVDLKTARPVVLLVVAGPPGKALSEDFGIVQADSVVNTLRSLRDKQVIDLIELVEPKFELRDDWKPTASWEAFRKAVAGEATDPATLGKRPNVIHFIGHGQRVYDGNQERSELIFVGKDGKPDPQRDTDFVQAVDKRCKLVFLQACESGVPGPHHSATSVGQMLAQRGIPAVVAMQTKVENIVANDFAKAFYESLRDRKPIDVAVREGRKAVKNVEGALKLAFGVPVLYLRSYDALISPAVAEPGAGASGAQASSIPAPTVQSPSIPPPPGPFATCPRCGSSQIGRACGNCGLRVVCSCTCPLPLAEHPTLDNPLVRFCLRCTIEVPQPPLPDRPVQSDQVSEHRAAVRLVGVQTKP